MILIIGENSEIGSHFFSYLKKKSIKFLATSRRLGKLNKGTIFFDLENPKLDKKILDKINSVFFFTGISNIKYCEENKKLCKFINYTQTKKIIRILLSKKVRVFFMSTSKIYCNHQKLPNELSKKCLNNYYSEQKYKIENSFLNNKYFTSLRIGKVLSVNYKKNKIFKKLLNNKKIDAFEDYYISPIYIDYLCNLLIRLEKNKSISGAFNVCSIDSISYYKFYCLIAKKFKMNKSNIIKSSISKEKNVYKELMSTNKINKLNFKIYKSKTHINKFLQNIYEV